MVYDTSASTMATNPYFNGTSPVDPLVFPARSLALLAKFPPTLLVTATRDFALSSTVYTHSRLVAQGVDAELHAWERSEEHTSELQSLMRISYAVFCLKKKTKRQQTRCRPL